jgi:hypothetical protein
MSTLLRVAKFLVFTFNRLLASIIGFFFFFFFADSKFCSNGGTKRNVYIIVGVAIGALFLLLFIAGILWWKGCLWRKRGRKEGAGYSRCLIFKFI